MLLMSSGELLGSHNADSGTVLTDSYNNSNNNNNNNLVFWYF